jgi:hypothetical protein
MIAATAPYSLRQVEPVGGYRLRLRFADGSSGIVDLASEIAEDSDNEVFGPLSNLEFFAQAFIGEYGELVWPNGADWAPDELWGRVKEQVRAPGTRSRKTLSASDVENSSPRGQSRSTSGRTTRAASPNVTHQLDPTRNALFGKGVLPRGKTVPLKAGKAATKVPAAKAAVLVAAAKAIAAKALTGGKPVSKR